MRIAIILFFLVCTISSHGLYEIRQSLTARDNPRPPRVPITLNLPRWISLREAGKRSPGGRVRVEIEEIFRYFIQMANDNSLGDTVAAEKLKAALDLIQSTTDPRPNVRRPERYSYGPAFHEVEYIAKIISVEVGPDGRRMALAPYPEQYVKYNLPIFNIWDSFSFLYTVCVEEIANDTIAQLHLLQFRTMIQVICEHRSGYLFDGPSTVAAAWPDPTDGEIIETIVFATTCSGPREEKSHGFSQISLRTRSISGIRSFAIWESS